MEDNNIPNPHISGSIKSRIWRALYLSVEPKRGNPNNEFCLYAGPLKEFREITDRTTTNKEEVRLIKAVHMALQVSAPGEINKNSLCMTREASARLAALVGLDRNIWGSEF